MSKENYGDKVTKALVKKQSQIKKAEKEKQQKELKEMDISLNEARKIVNKKHVSETDKINKKLNEKKSKKRR